MKTPRGETVRLLVEKGDNPWVTVVLFAGGAGVMDISDLGAIGRLRGNFLIRSRAYFQSGGAVTAVIDAPTDVRNTLRGFRDTEDHAQDIGAVVKHLRDKYELPVWLVGTSRGTNSVANAAVRLTADRPDGIVLTASMLSPPRQGTYVTAMDVDKITGPVLIAHHKDDGCRYTPAGLVDYLKSQLKNTKPVKVLMYEGGSGIRGNPCQARHYHGFAGLEQQVVADIMAWIRSPAP